MLRFENFVVCICNLSFISLFFKRVYVVVLILQLIVSVVLICKSLWIKASDK